MGWRPVRFFEKISSPSFDTSNTPPEERTSSTSAPGNASLIRASSLEAWGR